MNIVKKHRLIPHLEKEFKGDIWKFIGKSDAICITTNGCIDKKGNNIMGAGIAKEAKERFPDLPHNIGFVIDTFGNSVYLVKAVGVELKTGLLTKIMTFPTKPEWIRVNKFKSNILPQYRDKIKSGEDVMGWMGYSDLKLIYKSAVNLCIWIISLGWDMVIVPKPGTLNGGLGWEDVKMVLKKSGLYDIDGVHFIEKG
jgi:hypothetical protein